MTNSIALKDAEERRMNIFNHGCFLGTVIFSKVSDSLGIIALFCFVMIFAPFTIFADVLGWMRKKSLTVGTFYLLPLFVVVVAVVISIVALGAMCLIGSVALLLHGCTILFSHGAGRKGAQFREDLAKGDLYPEW